MARPQTHRRLASGISLALGTYRQSFSPIARFGIALIAAVVSFSARANTYIVNTNLDPGPDGTLSLRQAIVSANGADGNVIQFDNSLNGSTITLQQGTLSVTRGTDISANGQNITISGNDTSAIFALSGSPASMEGLTLTKGRSGAGGAIRDAGALTLSNMLITSNRTTGSGASQALGGGGIFVHGGGSLLMSDSRVTGNNSTGSGGAIHVTGFSTSAILIRCRIDLNTSSYYGGGIEVDSGASLTIEQSTIDSNRSVHTGTVANGGGGGLAFFNDNEGGAAVVSNSTITNNYAITGGAGAAIFETDATGIDTFRFTTITSNRSGTAGDAGNGIIDSGGTANLFASIVANNTDLDGTRGDLAGNFVANNSLILTPGAAVLSGTGSVLGVDPQLGPFGDHGGSTWTMVPAAGSPAIDAVTQSFAETTDQRGYMRPVGPAGDVGAVERQKVEDIIFRDGFEF